MVFIPVLKLCLAIGTLVLIQDAYASQLQSMRSKLEPLLLKKFEKSPLFKGKSIGWKKRYVSCYFDYSQFYSEIGSCKLGRTTEENRKYQKCMEKSGFAIDHIYTICEDRAFAKRHARERYWTSQGCFLINGEVEVRQLVRKFEKAKGVACRDKTEDGFRAWKCGKKGIFMHYFPESCLSRVSKKIPPKDDALLAFFSGCAPKVDKSIDRLHANSYCKCVTDKASQIADFALMEKDPRVVKQVVKHSPKFSQECTDLLRKQ